MNKENAKTMEKLFLILSIMVLLLMVLNGIFILIRDWHGLEADLYCTNCEKIRKLEVIMLGNLSLLFLSFSLHFEIKQKISGEEKWNG